MQPLVHCTHPTGCTELDAETELAMPVRVWRKIDKMC